MGVHHHRARHPEHVAQDQVRGLAAHAGQRRQLLHGGGDLAAVLFQDHLGAGHNVPGLGPEKAAGVNVALHLLHIRLGKALQRGKAGEEGGGDLVYPLVGALGGQAHGKEQLIILTVVQRAAGFRVFLQQQPDDLIYLFLGPHGHPSFCLGYKNGKLIVP